MRIVIRCRNPTESRVVVASKALYEGIAIGDRGHLGEAQLLYQAILQRAVGALDTTLGRRRVRADALDVEVMECAAELCNAFAAGCAGV